MVISSEWKLRYHPYTSARGWNVSYDGSVAHYERYAPIMRYLFQGFKGVFGRLTNQPQPDTMLGPNKQTSTWVSSTDPWSRYSWSGIILVFMAAVKLQYHELVLDSKTIKRVWNSCETCPSPGGLVPELQELPFYDLKSAATPFKSPRFQTSHTFNNA